MWAEQCVICDWIKLCAHLWYNTTKFLICYTLKTQIIAYSLWKILGKEFSYFLFTLIPHWIKHENFVMQLKKQSVVAWQIEKHYSKENNKMRNFQTSWPCEVQRPGQFRPQHLLFVQFSFRALTTVASLTKTTKNHRFFLNLVCGESGGFKKFQLYWVKELLLHNRMETFWKL